MSLEKEIARQYSQRDKKNFLYSGVYARQSLEERKKKMNKIVSEYFRERDTVLEVGAGSGDNVPLLMACGFKASDICLNEMLPDRISNIKNNFPSISLVEGDALSVTFKEKFDWVFQSTVFTSLLSESDRAGLAQKMWELLKPGGCILWYDFIYDNPFNKDVRGVSIAETKALFKGAARSEVHKITLAPPIGRRVGKLYALFNLPFLRSHILAVFQKPK